MTSKVLIVGGGPSGLITGYYLSKKGITVTIAEKSDKADSTFSTAEYNNTAENGGANIDRRDRLCQKCQY
ncbi:MAG: FAD-dependent oxidoreductase [Deltaproteobacteria bacterium]|nr:FAD-dependent oxidoreductase [Deltaproteobacteria bacterium]